MLALVGCATTPPPRTDITLIAPAATQSRVIAGQSKADVIAALGKTKILRFDSGVEVWVYYYGASGGAAMPQAVQADANAEFLVLFSTSGIVLKTRVRPAPQPAAKESDNRGG